MKIGIVGSEQAKFTSETEEIARTYIRTMLERKPEMVFSGGCHLGGIDIYAEEESKKAGIPFMAFLPKTRSWTGYRDRNLQIAKHSDIVYCITVKNLPVGYRGMTFNDCYHCKTDDHVKSGGCWTMKQAINMGKKGKLIVI